MSWDSLRLARLSLPGKVLVTLFLLIVGPGYLFGVGNILFRHQDADLTPGLSVDDLRRTFHGMEKVVTPEATVTVHSLMLEQVRPGGEMREYLEPGGEPAIRGLIRWLENGAKQEEFDTPGLAQEGDPSAKHIIATYCVECHHADGGEMEDVPYAASEDAEPDYDMVAEVAEPEFETHQEGPQQLQLAPTSVPELIHITHAHVLTMPVFTFLVGLLFLMTGYGQSVKLILGPLPMLAVLLDIGSWWLARIFEPAIYIIAGSGGLFGTTYALQILLILASVWLGRRES